MTSMWTSTKPTCSITDRRYFHASCAIRSSHVTSCLASQVRMEPDLHVPAMCRWSGVVEPQEPPYSSLKSLLANAEPLLRASFDKIGGAGLKATYIRDENRA